MIKLILDKILGKIIVYKNVRSQIKQINYYKNRLSHVVDISEIPEKEQEKIYNFLNNFNLFLPKVDPAKFLKCFYDVRVIKLKNKEKYVLDLHFVWNNEVFPLSKKIDEMYRKVRIKVFGRIADVESISVFYNDNIIYYPFDNFSFGLYSFGIHVKSIEIVYLPVIFSNSWNHMMSTRWTIDVVKRLGGYYKAKFTYEEGTRLDAEKYGKELLKEKLEEKENKLPYYYFKTGF